MGCCVRFGRSGMQPLASENVNEHVLPPKTCPTLVPNDHHFSSCTTSCLSDRSLIGPSFRCEQRFGPASTVFTYVDDADAKDDRYSNFSLEDQTGKYRVAVSTTPLRCHEEVYIVMRKGDTTIKTACLHLWNFTCTQNVKKMSTSPNTIPQQAQTGIFHSVRRQYHSLQDP